MYYILYTIYYFLYTIYFTSTIIFLLYILYIKKFIRITCTDICWRPPVYLRGSVVYRVNLNVWSLQTSKKWPHITTGGSEITVHARICCLNVQLDPISIERPY